MPPKRQALIPVSDALVAVNFFLFKALSANSRASLESFRRDAKTMGLRFHNSLEDLIGVDIPVDTSPVVPPPKQSKQTQVEYIQRVLNERAAFTSLNSQLSPLLAERAAVNRRNRVKKKLGTCT